MSTLTTIFVCVPTIKRSLIHSWLSISRPYFLLNQRTKRLVLKPEESTAKSVSTVLRGKLLTLGTLLYRCRMPH